jgi:hypothetical protein
MERKRRLSYTAIGAALSLLLGSGLIAIVSDIVSVPGNQAQSGTFAAFDLKGRSLSDGQTPGSGQCPASGTYAQGPFPAIVRSNVNVEAAMATDDGFTMICLKNDSPGGESGDVWADSVDLSDLESGDCGIAESGLGEDTTCADGSQGELLSILQFRWAYCNGDGSGCGFTDWFSAGNSDGGLYMPSQLLKTDFAVGQTLGVDLEVQVTWDPPLTNQQLARAQTDDARWAINFTLYP